MLLKTKLIRQVGLLRILVTNNLQDNDSVEEYVNKTVLKGKKLTCILV